MWMIKEVEEFCGNLQFEDRKPKQFRTQHDQQQVKEKEVKETQDIKQGKLNIGYRTNIVYGDPDYFALQMFNGFLEDFRIQSFLLMFVKKQACLLCRKQS